MSDKPNIILIFPDQHCVLGYSMVRDERYKMAVRSHTQQPTELYDMVNDPDELHNPVNDPSLEKVRRELLDRYLSYLLNHLSDDKLKIYEGMEGTI